jgi:hypothetical protein
MMDTPYYRLEDPADTGPGGPRAEGQLREAPDPDASMLLDPAHYKQSAIKRGATPVMASVMRGRAVQRWARAPAPPRP